MKPHRLQKFSRKPHIYRDAGGWCVLIGHWVQHLPNFEQAALYARWRGRIYR